MLYRPSISWIAANALHFPFSIKRWIRLPIQFDLGWIEREDIPDLREPTPLPILFTEDLKPGYYWRELIH